MSDSSNPSPSSPSSSSGSNDPFLEGRSKVLFKIDHHFMTDRKTAGREILIEKGIDESTKSIMHGL